MSEPKAKWEDDGLYWYASIGVYGLSVCPKYGDWTAHSDEPGYDAPGWFASGNVGTPCDVVTLMLAAESALATHLRAVADTMTWPEGEREEEAPVKASLTVATDSAKLNAQQAAIEAALLKCFIGTQPAFSAELSRQINVFDDAAAKAIIGKCSFAYPEFIAVDWAVSPPMGKLTNNSPQAIYVDGVRVEPSEALTFAKVDDAAKALMPKSTGSCAHCLQLKLGTEHNSGCPYTRERQWSVAAPNNKKPPTPEGTGGGR